MQLHGRKILPAFVRKSLAEIPAFSVSACALSYPNAKPLHLSFKLCLAMQRTPAEHLSVAGRQLTMAPRSPCPFLPLFGENDAHLHHQNSGHQQLPSAPQMGLHYLQAPAAISAPLSLPPAGPPPDTWLLP